MPISSPITARGARLDDAGDRIHQLDGLRGLLALFVALYHLLGPLPDLSSFLLGAAPIFLQGWYAVDVFFVMSGFVMLHVYGATFRHGVTLTSFLSFMWARVARLYPVHLFAMLATLLLLAPLLLLHQELFLAWEGRYSFGTFIGTLLMGQSPWVAYRSWNYPAWSISAEWHAYLLFPLLVLCLRKCSVRLSWVLIGLGALIPLLLYLSPYEVEQYPTNGVLVLLRVFPLFIVGMALHVVWSHVRQLPAALAAAVVMVTLALLNFPAVAPYAVLLVPLLVLAALGTPWLARWLSRAPLLWLGKISYSMYMTHALVEILMGAGLRHWQRWQGGPVALGEVASLLIWLAGALLAMALGWATWKWVEVPGRTYFLRYKGIFSKPARAAAQESPR